MSIAAVLIEDNQTIREALTYSLDELAGVQVIATAIDEEEAIDLLRRMQSQWQLAVIDLFLRKGTGLGVLRAVSDRRPGQICIVLTNYATRAIRQQCIDEGAQAVFDKSTELEQFFDYLLEQFRR